MRWSSHVAVATSGQGKTAKFITATAHDAARHRHKPWLRRPLPAPIHQELATAPVRHPHTSTVPAPAVTFGAARPGQLPLQSHPSSATHVDSAHLVLLAVAVALQTYPAVRVRTGPPAAADRVPAAVVTIALVITISGDLAPCRPEQPAPPRQVTSGETTVSACATHGCIHLRTHRLRGCRPAH